MMNYELEFGDIKRSKYTKVDAMTENHTLASTPQEPEYGGVKS